MIDPKRAIQQVEARFASRKAEREKRGAQLAAMKSGKDYKWDQLEDLRRLTTRAKRLGLFESASALLQNPGDTEAGNRILEKIIDANNLLGVTFLSEGARKSRAVCRIALPVTGGTRLGTGFMVSPRVMMTNNHVIEDEVEASQGKLEFDFFEREDGTTGPVTRFRMQPGSLFVTHAALDFTLVAVEQVNAAGDRIRDRGWFPLIGPSGKSVIGERVSIIQHPNGTPQKVTVHDNKVVDLDGPFLHYETDTMSGSSGAPVTNINWDLAALHHAAVGKANEGIRISAIVTKLREIFSQESGGVTAEPGVVAELMAGERPLDPLGHSPAVAAPMRVASLDEAPRINPDGTASWILPVSVTLGVGKTLLSPVPVDHKPEPRDDAPAPPSTPDPDLQEAIEAFEATEGRTYYSKTQDDAARKAYYPDLSGLTGKQLYTALSKLLHDSHTTTLSYKKARLTHLYPWIDRRENRSRELRGIYSNKVFDALEVIRQEVTMERRRESAFAAHVRQESLGPPDEAFLEELEAAHPFNCEHVVPQSWFNKRKQPKTDLHHLFTCEWGCNSFRGNHAYFDFKTEAYREDCGERENGKFEPKHGKGAVARATLYFLLRYPGDIADSGKEMPNERLKTLIEWANSDKIDLWELHRNAEIFKVQGNRNPLIDFPDLVEKIDFKMGWA